MANFLSPLAFILLIFLTPLAAQSSPCYDAVASTPSIPELRQWYTASPAFLEGELLANRIETVVNATNLSPRKQKDELKAILNEFMHDSRYRAKVPGSIELLKRRAGTAFGCIVSERPYFMYYLLQGVLSLNKGDNFGVTRHACRGSIPEELLEILEQAHDYGMSFLPTWEPLGIRAINRLYALRFYPVGLMDHDVKADGARMNRMKFLEHDLKHAIIYERIIRPSPQEEGRPPPNIFTQQFYRQFNYHANISRMSPNDQLLYDLGHFLYFHEGLGLSVFGHDLSWSIPKNNLQEFYRSTYFHGLSSEFRFEFSPSDEIRVLRRQDPKVLIRNLVYRLLDENDMRHQLPLEIETLIKNSPDKADEIVGNFAEKFLTLFFRIHYKVAKQTLELFESQNSP